MLVPHNIGMVAFNGGYTSNSMKNVITHQPKYRNFSFEELRLKYVQEQLKENESNVE